MREAIKVDIHVIRNLTCNLILSSGVLFQANTYNNPNAFQRSWKSQCMVAQDRYA